MKLSPCFRYLAICHTLNLKINHRVARLMIIFIWLMAATIMAPWAVYYQQKDISNPRQTLFICNQYWPEVGLEKGYFLGAIFLTCYSMPLVFISACYTAIGCRVVNRRAPGIVASSDVIQKSKVKVLKMLVCVVVLFAFSWLPLYAVQVRIYFGGPLVPESGEFSLLTQIVVPVSQWLGASNSCVNPIVYCFFSNKFRRGFTEMVRCRRRPAAGAPYLNRNNSATCRNGNAYYSSIRSSGTDADEKRSSGAGPIQNRNRVTFV
ncbi:hypothetical protein LSH36_165g06022 [Paralvinella palmiformis]|uniref:G-protein coupled receptors family 1 profile domain-containing protein n=1 Tax=Paralvinella palmiformis TaxID=53620 RepID=A0AAD9JSS6_9ANNE|nr:hypothetical protein LSH36_165g06022 [Paralvinella palmiformis]